MDPEREPIRAGAASRVPAEPSAVSVAGGQHAGRQLDATVRKDMEARFGHDFGRVRVRADEEAAASARAIDAAAYTRGDEIVFGAGRYRPETGSGRRLLAHELAHVVQNDALGAAAARATDVSGPGDHSEVVADEAAAAASHAARPHSLAAPGAPSAAPDLSVRSPGASAWANLSARRDSTPALSIQAALRASRPSRARIQRVPTWAGDYTTDEYRKNVDSSNHPIGVHIKLRFKPNRFVNAKKFNLVQTATDVKSGKVHAVNRTVRARSIPAGEPGEGAHIDRKAQFDDPLYGTEMAGSGGTLANTPTIGGTDELAQHGFRFKDKTGEHIQDAWLVDNPELGGVADSSQIFETTTLAVDGVQRGTYYGSVQWGWRTDATGALTPLPLTVVANDVPSPTFAAAAELWGTVPTSSDTPALSLPSARGMYTNTAGVWLVTNPTRFTTTRQSRLEMNTRVEVTDIGLGQSFNADPSTRWWKVAVVDGASVGKVGWVMEKDLSEART